MQKLSAVLFSTLIAASAFVADLSIAAPNRQGGPANHQARAADRAANQQARAANRAANQQARAANRQARAANRQAGNANRGPNR